MLKGLIFDLDGVITDSARFHLAAWNELARQLGIELPPEANDDLRGRSRMDSLAVILNYGGQVGRYSEEELAAFAAQKNAAYTKLIAGMTEADVLPGIHRLLDDAKTSGLTMAIASASRNAPVILNQLRLTDYFTATVDPNDLQHGKPDPEIFVRAQKLLGLQTDEVISFEDASAGVQAIKAAGQYAVGIGDVHVLAAADYNVPDTGALVLSKIKVAFDTQTQTKEEMSHG
ncbi:beta-phosphoglucomutase [Lacticaseibacillus songhuajiangensis]|jgi:beta-phosphoglucomutase|uniref:beta-phosphoglucomutase n=1 Tax=Lacticaseibacillus songhuajiangensis TaxID=1296539 RepID=UPI000F79D732|nr:beta-phosphoglucomutase [Lacticaseibacillus songhuajiangensis]